VDIGDIRQEYKKMELSRKSLDKDPMKQFQQWFDHAIKAEVTMPNAMTLATADNSGSVSVRTVLLKTYDENGFVFFTNYASKKAKQISDNNQVALLFPWLELERQVKIVGTATKVSTAESLKYFVSRPKGSQLGAWCSPQSDILSSRQMLEMKFNEMKTKFANKQIPLPDFWGGYRVKHQSMEFWQGRSSRLHDRFEYTKDEQGEWQIQRLAP
jgi:pyridoxamine 5'-phosphate oxidase